MAKDAPEHTGESLTPDTTSEQDLHSKGQRAIDTKWENVQAFIALWVVVVTTSSPFYSPDVFSQLAPFGTLIVGFYFGRTNHSRGGGVVQRP